MLAAIVFTDAVGFSSRVHEDEATALAFVEEDFGLMTGLCGQFGGEVVKNTGDGLLMVFPSAVDAVSCAVDIQQRFAGREVGFSHRIGVHLGDVLSTKGDVFGDGVNIAARLMGLAGAGEVYVSGAVADMVRGKFSGSLKSVGRRSLKGISAPVSVFSVTGLVGAMKKERQRMPLAGVIALTVILTVLGLFVVREVMRRPLLPGAKPLAASGGSVAAESSLGQEWTAELNDQDRSRLQEAISTYNFETVVLDLSEKESTAELTLAKSHFEQLAVFWEWLKSGLSMVDKSNPLVVSGSYGGEKVSMRAWMDGGKLYLEENDEVRMVELRELAPWKVRMLAFGLMDRSMLGQDSLMVAEWLVNFSDQFGLPVPRV